MSYPVGTICIGQNHLVDLAYNGMECEIIEPCRMFNMKHLTTGASIGIVPAYTVRWADGLVCQAEPKYLKRKDWYDEEKRAEDRQKVSKLIAGCKKAAEEAKKAGIKPEELV